MNDLTHLSIFSGIGGLDIAAEMAGFRTVGQCERANYPTKVLEKHWPDVPRWRDIRDLSAVDFRRRTGIERPTIVSGGSLVSRTALQESVKRLVTSVIYGQKCGESLASLSQDGLWLKTYQDFYQVKMDGSFEEYCGTLPRWGLMLDGQLIQPHGLEPYIDESEWRLLPTPIASDAEGGVDRRQRTITGRVMTSTGNRVGPKLRSILCDAFQIQRPHPYIYEAIMGYEIGHTELGRSETR